MPNKDEQEKIKQPDIASILAPPSWSQAAETWTPKTNTEIQNIVSTAEQKGEIVRNDTGAYEATPKLQQEADDFRISNRDNDVSSLLASQALTPQKALKIAEEYNNTGRDLEFLKSEVKEAERNAENPTEIKRQNKSFKLDKHAWADTEGTTGKKRNETNPDDDAYHWSGHTDENGNWVSGLAEWADDNQARINAEINAYNTAAEDRKSRTEEEVQAHQQELANLYYDCGELEEYAQGVLDEFKAKYDQTYQGASEEEKKALDAELARLEGNQKVYESWKQSAKEMYDGWSNRNEVYGSVDESNKYKIDGPDADVELFASSEYMTPEMIQEEIENLDSVIDMYKGEKTKEERDLRADALTRKAYLEETLLPEAQDTYNFYKNFNDDLDVIRENYLFAPEEGWNWVDIEKDLIAQQDNAVLESDRQAIQKNLDFVHRRMNDDTKASYKEKWKNASASEIADRMVAIQYDIPTDTSPSATTEAFASADYDNLAKLEKERDDKVAEYARFDSTYKGEAKEKAQKKQELWSDIQRLETEINTIKVNGPIGVPDKKNDKFAYSFFDKPTEREMSAEEEIELSVLQELYREKTIAPYEAMYVAGVQDTTHDTGAAWVKKAEEAVAKAQESLSPLLTNDSALQKAQEEVRSMGRISDRTIEDLKAAGIYDDLMKYLDKDTSDRTFEEKLAAFSAMSAGANTKASDEYARAVMELSWARSLEAYELTHSKDYAEKVAKGAEKAKEFADVIDKAMFFSRGQGANPMVVLQQAGISEKDAKELTTMFVALGIDKDMYTPRVKGTDKEKVSLLDNILSVFKTDNYDAGAERGYFTDEQYNAYLYYLGNNDPVGAVKYALSVNSNINDIYKADIAHRYELRSKLYGEEDSAFSSIKNAIITPVISAPLAMTGIFDTIRNVDQLVKLGQTYSSANFSLMEQGELMDQAAMGALTVGKAKKTSDVINFFYGAYRSAVQSAETLAFGGLIADAIGATASTIVNLPLAKTGINAERLVTGAFSDVTFFGSAAASTFKELKSAGVDEKLAMVASLASGVNEALFEHFSIENLYKIKNFQSWGKGFEAAKNFIFTTVQQGLIEGSEEFATGLANFISQKVILGDASDFDRNVTAYMEQYRIPRDQAVKFASQDLAREWAVEFAAGVVSGAAGAGFRSATSYIGDRAQYRGYREAVGKLYNETQFGDKTAAKLLGEYLYDYDFMQGKNESQFTEEMLDSIDDIHELAEKAKNGTASEEEIGRMVTITENFDPDILIDLAGAHPEWYAVVEPYKFLAAYQKKKQALLGSQAGAYMKAVASAAQSDDGVYIASNFEEHLRNSGIELSEKEMHDLTSFLEDILVGSTAVNENTIRNAFREGPLADPKVQMAVWSYLSLSMDENQGQGYDQELYETILPLLQNSGEVTIENVSTELANTLAGTWDYLRRANEIEASYKRAMAASVVAQAEAGRASSKLVKNLAANRSDNDFVRVNGKDTTRKEFVEAAKKGKNAITGEDLPFGNMTEERANNYFDGRIIAYAMAPQSQGEAFTEKFDLLTGQVRNEEAIKRLQERIAQMKKGSPSQSKGKQTGNKSNYKIPKNAVDKTQGWVQLTEEELEKAIPKLKSEIDALTKKQKDLYNTRTLLAGSADAEAKKANKTAITKVTAELKAKQTQLKNAERDLAVLKARKGKQNEALSSGTSERGSNANVGGATGTVQSGQVGSAQPANATGSGGVHVANDETVRSGRSGGRGRESVNAAGVEMENGYILFDTQANSNEDDLTSTELALLNRAKELGAERVIFVNAENAYNENGNRIAGVYDIVTKTLVYNVNTDNRHGAHEVDHVFFAAMSPEEKTKFLDGFVNTTFKNRKKLLSQLLTYYKSVNYGLSDDDILEEIFCDIHNGLDRMAQLKQKSLISDEDLQMFKDRTERYLKSSGVEEQIKAKLGTGTAQTTEQKSAPQSQIVGTNNMTVNSEEDFQAVQNALMKLKDKESFFFKYNGKQYVITVDESKDYGTSYKVAETVSPSQIFNAKSIGSSDTAAGVLDIVRNGATTTESKPAEQTEAKAEEKPTKKRSSKKKQAFKTEENLRATNGNSEYTRKRKNGKTLVELRKWTDKITNPVTEEGTITRADFVEKATTGWPELDDIGEPTTMTMAEAQDAFDEWRAAQNTKTTQKNQKNQKYSILDEHHNDWAPAFYSKLENVINEWTGGNGQKLGPKMAAGSVVAWLKGKGVKDEEIKWSGILPYLEGKKSVTQEELQRVLAENRLDVETVLLTSEAGKDDSYRDTVTGKIYDSWQELYDEADRMAESMGYSAWDTMYRPYKETGIQVYVIGDNEEEIPLITSENISLFPTAVDRVINKTVWRKYTLPLGSSYREVLFKNPKSDYSNAAMTTHWRDVGEAFGVLAHARIDDMRTEDRKQMLFVEEIQSDWNNAARAKDNDTGETRGFTSAQPYYELERIRNEGIQVRRAAKAQEEQLERIAERLISSSKVLEDYAVSDSIVAYLAGRTDDPTVMNEMPFVFDFGEDIVEEVKNEIDSLLTDEERNISDTVKEAWERDKALRAEYRRVNNAVPNAPYAGEADTYHEYVMKHLLRMAAEGNYDKIGWTTAQQQVDRWSKEYEEGYKIEYDQNIPKFMRKYVRQWGATVGAANLENGQTVWSVDITPQMKQDVLYKGQMKYSILDDIKSDTKNYGPGVLFDSSKFTNGEDWVDIANDFVQSMAGQTVIAHDIDTGEDVNLLIANRSQTHRKGTNTGTTPTLGELKINANDIERGVEKNKARFLIHLPEVIQVARSNHSFTRPQGPTHGYVDSKGWRYYRVYGMDMDGNIYAAFLNIAQGALGDTLYTITAYPKPIDRNTHVQNGIENEPLGASDSTMTSEEPTGMATSRDSMFDILSQKFNVVKNIDKKYSILGMTAKGADFGKLSKAVDMELNDATANEIWRETGWFRGIDGKWKFEIYDGDFDVNTDLVKKMKRDFAKNKKQTMNVTLSDILIGADELFENYPEIGKIPVSFADLGEDILGTVDNADGTLLSSQFIKGRSVNRERRVGMLSTLMHEIQHIIQNYENFAYGTSEDNWQSEQDMWKEFVEKEVFNPRNRAEQELDFYSRTRPEMYRDVTQLADLREQARNGEISEDVYEQQLKKIINKHRAYNVAQILYDYDLIQELEGVDYYSNWLNEDPYTLYRNTAGEVEARDVQDRLGLTREERISRRPNTPLETSIFNDVNSNGRASSVQRNRYSILEDRGNVGYNEPNGGITNDTRRSSEEDTGRTSSLYGDLDTNAEGRGGLGGLSETTGSVRLSNQSIQTIKDSGIVYVEINPTTDNAAFSMRLDEARNADPDHGWAVSPKDVDEIEEGNLRLFMSADGSTGFAIAPDGDIEAVFRNQLTGTRKSTMSSLPLAIANGGTKLDCYGTGLLNFYTQYGFIPVARVTFNPKYANPGWTPEKGYPDIIFMMHNGDSADEIIRNHGKYHVYTAEEIAALPLYDKEGYMDAYDFRDKELAKLQAEFTPQQRKYSVIDERHNEFAPVFYSKMQQAIEEWTTNSGKPIPGKMGAGQVVSWLKGKGVKQEEIKWSGIEQYLEGKKSVTRDELLRFMDGNELTIETVLLSTEDVVPNEEGVSYINLDDDTEYNSFDEVIQAGEKLAEKLFPGEESEIEVVPTDDDGVSLVQVYLHDFGYFPLFDIRTSATYKYGYSGIDRAVSKGARWQQHTLPRGENYREVLFKLPYVDYSNENMERHFNKSGEGYSILAYARIDDMRTRDYDNVLFVEELQSDWHNAGAGKNAKFGTEEEYSKFREQYDTYMDQRGIEQEIMRSPSNDVERRYSRTRLYYHDRMSRIGYDIIDRDSTKFLYNFTSAQSIADYLLGITNSPFEPYRFSYIRNPDPTIDYSKKSKELVDKLVNEEEKKFAEEGKQRLLDCQKELWGDNLVAKLPATIVATDVPYAGSSDTYHEYVMKHLLRMAAEGNYDKIAWTNSQQQVNRWSPKYATGYHIEYDQSIVNFMKKYTRPWGGKVDVAELKNGEIVWSVDITPEMKRDVLYKGQPKYSILETAKEVSDTYHLDLSDLDLADILLLSPEELLELDRALGISESSYDTEASEEDTVEEPEEEIEEEEPYIPEERRPSKRVENGERNPTAFLKQETLDIWLSGNKGFASPISKNYAQAYIGWMNPDDFLFLSTGSYESEDIKRAEGYYGDEENISQRAQSGYRADTIYLKLDHETGKLYGHEGRHRMDFLQRLGVENVPVLFFDDSNKSDKEVLHNPTLIGEWNNNRRVTLDTDLIPLNENNRAVIEAEFVNREGENPNKPTVRFSLLAEPEETYDAFGDPIQLDSYNLTDLTTSDLSEKMYYSSDGNTAYYRTPDNQTVVLQNIGEDSPEAQYIRYLEAMNNANDINNTTTKPYIIPPRPRNEDNGHSVGEQDAGLRRGTEEIPAQNQEGALRRRGSIPELYGQSRPQSEEEESVRKYSILVGPNEKSNRGDTTFPIVNENGETITTADVYPLESFERHLLTAVRDNRTQNMEDVINEWFNRGGRIGDDSWEVLANDIKENQNYSEDEKKALYAAIEKARNAYGDLAKGRDDKKANVILPKKVDNGDGTTRNIRKNIQTTAANVDNDLLTESLMFKAMNDEMMGYTPQSNPETVQKARDMIKNQFNGSFDQAYDYFRALKESGKLPSAVDIALGEILIKEFGDGDRHPDSMNKAINVAADLAILGTDLGQAIQALRIIKKATPQGQLYYLDGVVKRLNATYAQRIKDGKMNPVEIKEKLAARLLSASTRQELNDAIEAIKDDLANQIPVTLWDQWNAWRYLAMLGNPRTHIRNVLGNALFMPIVFVKDMALRRLQNENSISNRLLSAAMGGEIIGDEFRTMVSGADLSGWLVKNNSNPYVKFARDDYQLMKDIVQGKKSGSKYSDANDIISRRKIFENGPIKSKFLQKYNDFNTEWLGKEDTGFQEKYYVRYLAEYLQAQGVTEDQLTGDNMFSTTPEGRKLLNRARQHATLQAQRDTYHEMNQFAMELNRMKGKGGWRYVLGEGLVPFTGTPANLLKLAAVQYSPYGLIRSIAALKKSIRNGNKDTAAILDGLASGLTGTGLILLGAALAAGGLGFKLRGAGPDDDKEAEFEEMQGHQSWSIETDKWSYTIDWMAPLCMPLFVGATMYELFNRELDLSNPSAFSTLLFGIANPMLSMSMLDGIENTLSSLKYGGKNAMATLAASMLTSYFAQGMPTIAGQFARSMDDRRRATYIDPNSKWPGSIQQFWQSSIQNKLPDVGQFFGLDWYPSEENKAEYVDLWGRNQMTGENFFTRALQNFLSPGYFRWINETAVDDELSRLYEAIGGKEGKGALPTSVGKEIGKQNQGKDDNGEPIVIDGKKLTADEYVKRQKVKGQTAYTILSEMFNDELYQNATDTEKLKMVDEAYKFAESLADQAIIPERSMASSWMDTAKKFGVSDYILIKQDYDENKSNEKVYDWILSTPDLTTDQMAILFADKFSVPDYIDSEATGYRYKMLNADEEPLTALNETILQQRLPELFSNQRFIDADPDEKAIRLKEFISDIRDETLQNYSNMLSTTSREYTLGKASRLTNDQRFEVMLDAKNGDHREQANWIADSFKADKIIDNPDHMGYEFELDEAEIGEHGWMYDRVHELYADAYEKLWTDNKKFKDAVARNDKKEMAAIAHDTWNAVVQQAETEYGHMLNQNGTGKEKFKETPTGYSSMDAYKIAREKYGDDYKAIGRYIAQTVDNHTTIEDPEKPGFFIVLNSAEQERGKKDRSEMFAEFFATEAKKDYFKMATDEEKAEYIKGFISAVDKEYQKQYAEKIKKAGYDTELTKKLNSNDTSAKEFLAHMEKNSYSKEETIDLMMARYKVDHDLQDVNYNPAGRVLQMNAARKYYEDHYEEVKSGAMTWENYRKNASTAANQAASGAFGVKSVGKIPEPDYTIPGINPSFPSDTGTVTTPNPSKVTNNFWSNLIRR